MNLQEIILKVKEENLTKTQLEHYHTKLSTLLALYLQESAKLEKEEALFMNSRSQDETVASRKYSWKASESGQKLIDVKSNISAVKPLISSVKSRLFNFI